MELLHGIETRHSYIIKLTQQPYFKLSAASYCSDAGIIGLNPTWDIMSALFCLCCLGLAMGQPPFKRSKLKLSLSMP